MGKLLLRQYRVKSYLGFTARTRTGQEETPFMDSVNSTAQNEYCSELKLWTRRPTI